MTPEPPDDEALGRELRASRHLHEAPEAVIQRAIHIMAAHSTVSAPVPGALKRLIATLSFDSAGLTPLAAGLRAEALQTRQLLYSTEGRDVDLRIAATDDGRHFVISGQVLGPDVAGAAVLSGPEGESTVAWSELSEFHFDAVGPGVCQLSLRAGDWEIQLPPLQLGTGG